MSPKRNKPIHCKLTYEVPVFGLLILVLMLSGCYMPTAPSPEDDSPGSSSVNIIFSTVLSQPLTPGERLVIEVLDEVTGLPYNPLRYDMQQISELEYQSSLTITKDSVLKYRYSRIGSSITPEASTDGNPIRYRLVYGNANHTFFDTIAAWEGEGTSLETGVLKGTILDITTNEPIPDILVNAGGITTFTDMNGSFNFNSLPVGLHNVVFYSADGSFGTFQQEAIISSGLTTTAAVTLQPMPLINVTLIVNAPGDDFGLPIHIAGNLTQLGNTFKDLKGGMSVKPDWLPTLTEQADGTHTISLALYEQTDVRFIFTLGDGYWNAEQFSSGAAQARQLIVPDHDITLNLDIHKWRSNEFEPVIFKVMSSPDSHFDTLPYIQFMAASWTEPIPLWQTSPESYIFVLFSPLDSHSNITYRFCTDQNCANIISWNGGKSEDNLQAGTSPLTIPINFDVMAAEIPTETGTQVLEANIPFKGETYTTAIELTSEMDPSWLNLLPQKMTGISSLSANTVIFSPPVNYSSNPPFFQSVIGFTPFNRELTEMIKAAQTAGFSIGLYPQISVDPTNTGLIESTAHTEQWWNDWLEQYSKFVISYAKLAEFSNVSSLYIGGKIALASFQGGTYPDGTGTDAPENSDADWQKLINEIRQVYHGQLVWVSNAGQTMDPLPAFITGFDQIYISIDSPLTTGFQPIIEDLGYNFTTVIDNLIYEVYRSTGKPIILAFGYPSIDGGAQGCQIIDPACLNDGLFSYVETNVFQTDFDEQALVYNAVFPIAVSRSWITGISIRGYEPISGQLDGASSIANKPAEAVIQYWYSGLLGY